MPDRPRKPRAASSASDVDLNACIAGDRDAWQSFADRYRGVILVAVRRVMVRHVGVRAEDEIDDAVQDVFMRLLKDDFRLLGTFDPGRAAITTWLTLVARSVAVDHLRRRRKATQSLEPDHHPINTPPPARTGPEIPTHILTERQRVVLTMLFDQEMTVPEAARLIGVDEQTIRSTKHKALSRLRAHMIADSEGKPPVSGDA